MHAWKAFPSQLANPARNGGLLGWLAAAVYLAGWCHNMILLLLLLQILGEGSRKHIKSKRRGRRRLAAAAGSVIISSYKILGRKRGGRRSKISLASFPLLQSLGGVEKKKKKRGKEMEEKICPFFMLVMILCFTAAHIYIKCSFLSPFHSFFSFSFFFPPAFLVCIHI